MSVWTKRDKDGDPDSVGCQVRKRAVAMIAFVSLSLCVDSGQEDAEGGMGTGGSSGLGSGQWAVGALQSSRTRMVIGRPVYF